MTGHAEHEGCDDTKPQTSLTVLEGAVAYRRDSLFDGPHS